MKIQKHYRALACATMSLAVIGFASPAFAEGDKPHKPKYEHSKGGKHKGKMLEKLDTNKDGSISKGEFITAMEGKFAAMDKDGSGEITAAEMEEHHKEKRAEMKKMREEMKEKRGDKPPRHGDDMPPPPAE